MRVLLGWLLMVEGFASGVRFMQFVPVLNAYPPLTIVMLFLRVGTALLQFAGGWTLTQKRPAGLALGRTALLVSAVLTTLEHGLRLAPSNLFPAYRWPAVGVYGIYALVGIWVLRSPRR